MIQTSKLQERKYSRSLPLPNTLHRHALVRVDARLFFFFFSFLFPFLFQPSLFLLMPAGSPQFPTLIPTFTPSPLARLIER